MESLSNTIKEYNEYKKNYDEIFNIVYKLYLDTIKQLNILFVENGIEALAENQNKINCRYTKYSFFNNNFVILMNKEISYYPNNDGYKSIKILVGDIRFYANIHKFNYHLINRMFVDIDLNNIDGLFFSNANDSICIKTTKIDNEYIYNLLNNSISYSINLYKNLLIPRESIARLAYFNDFKKSDHEYVDISTIEFD